MTESIVDNAEVIQLDDDSLELQQLSMPTLMREISLHKRPNVLLFKMMNMLEKKRQKKGLGWSRAWNKYGLNVFRTHLSDIEKDCDYLAPAEPFLRSIMQDIPEPYDAFISDLLSDTNHMAFTFYHNHDDGKEQHEGLTLSFGRKVVADMSKRDRLDIVLEDKRSDGAVDGHIDRVRIYICPWETYQDKNFHFVEILELDDQRREMVQDLYKHTIEHYHKWKGEEERQWSHWSVRYIDYFGPRTFIPKGSALT